VGNKARSGGWTWTVIRDAAQWTVGTGLAIQEITTREEPRWQVLVFAGVLMGIPALIGLVHLPSTAGKPETPDTPELQSGSQRSLLLVALFLLVV
jgi:hypothetical protein